jgi:hypothetical protein
MKKIGTVFLMLFGLNYFSYCQKSKTEVIWSGSFQGLRITANFSLDEENNKELSNIVCYGQDDRFREIVSLITVFRGSPKDAVNWFKSAIDFYNKNEGGTSTVIDGQTFSLRKSLGIKQIIIFELGHGSGFHIAYKKQIENGLKALEEWIIKNKINVNDSVKQDKFQLLTDTTNERSLNSNNLLIADELIKLKKLMDEGILTKEEFEAQKKKLLEK